MPTNNGPIARSNYRQLRVTATLEYGGRLSYSVYAKPLNAAWSEQRCIVRDHLRWADPIVTPEDCILALIEVLREQLLPGIDS